MSLPGWGLVFLAIAVIAAIFGFAVLAPAAGGVAKILFFMFLLIFVITLLAHLFRGRPPV